MEYILQNKLILYALFHVFVVGMLALDLGVFHRHGHVIKITEALLWSGMWIALALLFSLFVYYRYEHLYPGTGGETMIQFISGFLTEKSLSVDNLFVFLLLMNYFRVPAVYQHRVLFWGVLGAIIFRMIFIGLGAILISRFHWILYLFGIFLIFAGIKTALKKDQDVHPEHSPILKLIRKIFPVVGEYHGSSFFIKTATGLAATPMFVVLILIETSDILFAVDSIPAVFAITQDPFIVYTSNIFAILGLRSLYFAIAGVMRLFHHLHYGLSAILVFVGVKMLIAESFHIKIHSIYSLAVIIGCIIISILASLIWPQQETEAAIPAPESSPSPDSK